MNNRIGRYEIQAELGRGGFGRVYQAYDPSVNRQVAIKTLATAEDPELLRRFRNEASAAGRLGHQNIVIIYDFGEHDGSPYLVMELLKGEDLDKIINRRGAVDILQSIDIMLQVAAGLHHAHRHGIIHRDVKPANIMLLSDGTAKVLDFGIALLSQTATASRLTPQGSMLGTLTYMAPEQFNGAAPGVSTDIFAYGVTFYKLLTGQHPFQAAEMAEQMYKIVSANPAALRTINPACPEALDQAVSKMLAKDPRARHRSFEDVRSDLARVMRDLQQAAAEEWLAQARNALKSGELEKAQLALQQTLQTDPGNRDAIGMRDHLQSLIEARQARAQAAALAAAARQDLSTQDFAGAIEKLESARKFDKSDAEIEALLRQATAQQSLLEAHAALDCGDLETARFALQQTLQADSGNRDALTLRDHLQSLIEAREKRAQVAALTAAADQDLHTQNFVNAIQKLERARRLDESNPELQALLRHATAQQSLAHARVALDSGDLETARFALQQTLQLDPSNPDGLTIRDRLQSLIEARQTRAQVAALAAAARQDLQTQDFVGAIRKLELARRLDESDDELPTLLRQATAQQSLSQVRVALDSGEVETARLASQQTLQVDPSNRDAVTLHGRLESLRRPDEALALSRPDERILADEAEPDTPVLPFPPATPLLPSKEPIQTISPKVGLRRVSKVIAATGLLILAAGVFFLTSRHNYSKPLTDDNRNSLKVSKIADASQHKVTMPQEKGPTLITSNAAIPETPVANENVRPRQMDTSSKVLPTVVQKPLVQESPSKADQPSASESPPIPQPADPSLAQNQSVLSEQEKVLATLNAFSQAVQQKDISRLRQEWPSISNADLDRWQQKFQNAESISYVLEPGTPQVDGLLARVQCQRTTRERYPGANADYTNQRNVHATLQKLASEWKIVSLY